VTPSAFAQLVEEERRKGFPCFYMNWGQEVHSKAGFVCLQGFLPGAAKISDVGKRSRPEPIDGNENPARLVRYLQDFFSCSSPVFLHCLLAKPSYNKFVKLKIAVQILRLHEGYLRRSAWPSGEA
jgi:hypothetical protein